MRIALLSANIGLIDEIRAPIKQKHEYEFFYYTENNLPAPLPHLNNRLKGKYLKTQSHKFLDHDLFIWVDASVQITDGTFIDWVIRQMEGCDTIGLLHDDRETPYEELKYIMKQMKRGNDYLLKRYAKEPFKEEIEFYIKEGLPEVYSLYQCWFFARWNNTKLNTAFDDWWDKILCYSNFDQSQFSYIAYKHDLKVGIVDCKKYLKRHSHL